MLPLSKHSCLLQPRNGRLLFTGRRSDRRERRQISHFLVQGGAYFWRVNREGAMAENVGCNALPVPLCQVSGPRLEKWFVHCRRGIADIAQEDETGGQGDAHRHIRFALASLHNALFLAGTYPYWA